MQPTLGLTTRYLFFTGKGGVGKTTLACATAIELADSGKKVLLVSTDPASNLDEMLGAPLALAPREVVQVRGLFAANVDPQQAADDYRARVLGPYAGVVSEAELATMREELAGACTTEIAAFDRFAGLLAGDASGFDHVIFDTAPTGHTLRLLELPRAWTSFLDTNTRGASCLGPHGGLTLRRDRFAQARRALEDPALTTIALVARPDAPSLKEAARTAKELSELGLKNQRLLINGLFRASFADDPIATALERRSMESLAAMPQALAGLPRVEVPLRPYEMVGIEALRAVLREVPIRETGATPELPAIALPRLTALVDSIAEGTSGLVMVMGKGGVGKTTIAAAIAVALAGRGREVHLSTTDPAAHLTNALSGTLPHLEVSRIDPEAETRTYMERVMATKGKDLDAEGRALLLEDLRSPCTEEVAIFHAFSHLVAMSRRKIVVLDTAPTGHTLLLLDATGAYHRDVLRGMSPSSRGRLITPLMSLRDPSRTKILLVTLAETTPVSEAARLQEDLRRAEIEPWAWVINASLAAAGSQDPLLKRRIAVELRQIERVQKQLSQRLAVVPWSPVEPRGVEALQALLVEARPRSAAP